MTLTASDVAPLSKSLSRWELAEYIFEGLVIIACVGELVADLGRKWLGNDRKERLERWSTMLLVAALSVELICLVKTNSLSGMLVGSLSDKAEAADNKSQSAIDKSFIAENKANAAGITAGKAQQKANAAETKADTVTLRMGAASRELSTIEKDVVSQGPRWRLLQKAAPELVKQLARFAGQKVDLFVCGTRESADGETLSTWGRIADIVESNGAKWSVLHGGLSFWDTRPLGCQDIMVYVSSRASKSTTEAAEALSSGLTKTLPPSVNKTPSKINPDFELSVVKRGLEPEGAPWVLVAKDPDLITVLIGAHPQTEPSKSKTHK